MHIVEEFEPERDQERWRFIALITRDGHETGLSVQKIFSERREPKSSESRNCPNDFCSSPEIRVLFLIPAWIILLNIKFDTNEFTWHFSTILKDPWTDPRSPFQPRYLHFDQQIQVLKKFSSRI